LSDSLALIGQANVEMVNNRKLLIKKELPEKLKTLCNSDSEFSTNLFGDNLAVKLREATETSRLVGGSLPNREGGILDVVE